MLVHMADCLQSVAYVVVCLWYLVGKTNIEIVLTERACEAVNLIRLAQTR
jgi:hypothetical protein